MPKTIIIFLVLLTFIIVGSFLLNPAELLREMRDREREKDLETLRAAIETYINNNSAEILVDSNFCPSCEEGKVYSYSTEPVTPNVSTTARKSIVVNSTGWVPLDFSLNAKLGATPLKILPLDPLEKITLGFSKLPLLNSLAPKREGFIYTFSATKTGKYKLTAKMESKRGIEKAKNDGGHLNDRLEIGNDLDLKPK